MNMDKFKDYQLLIGLLAIAIAIYYGLREQPVSITKSEFESCVDYSAGTGVTRIEALMLCVGK
tara:strand:+ start:281 stop:469 length:189 start_codon:yes stop_codon:yes gene_type:complete